ncbi:hypothetical protein [Butyrivibrio sp. INlla21]|uniref:hypothetical protein n=1 Tax=Butyrivibrio sp. INlla21 TaxID=1520811 RepID=UPI0008EF3DCE|nr:hypothetical protein [Butyrivibrio sp. INlla21]SFU57344.1 hypothetical protein SAMN02910342_00940 [Butyrivibrio sp. INlla21]
MKDLKKLIESIYNAEYTYLGYDRKTTTSKIISDFDEKAAAKQAAISKAGGD